MHLRYPLLAAAALFGQTLAQTNKCIVCTSAVPITDITADDGVCYFARVDLTKEQATCDGSCYVKYTSKDGVIQTVDRGCIAAGVASGAANTGIDMGAQGDAGFDGQEACEAKIVKSITGAAGDIDFSIANADRNDLTEVTCAKTCASNDVSSCNGPAMDVQTLSDCGSSTGGVGLCGTAGVCNHWTGQCAFSCIALTERPVLDSATDTFTCTAYDNCVCNDAAAASLIPGTVTCQGTGLVGSSGACVCNLAGDVFTANVGCATPVAPVVPVVPVVNNKCIQCSSDLDSGTSCAAGTGTATECPNANDLCAAVVTMWVNTDGESVREVIERGCALVTEGVQLDTCEFNTVQGLTLSAAQTSEINTATSTEISCRYTCDTDGCNSVTPDGADTTYTADSMCNVGVICNGLTACSTVGDYTTTVATTAATAYTSQTCTGDMYCKSTMKYLNHVRYDDQIERSLIHLSYECASASETTEVNECTSSDIGTNYKNSADVNFVSKAQTNTATGARANIKLQTCSTICDGNNCNDNWPGQPKCYTCAHNDVDGTGALLSATNSDHCYTDVNPPAACANYFDNRCYVQQSGLDLSSNWAQKSMNYYSAMQSMGAYRSIMRGCESSDADGVTAEGSPVHRDEDQAQTVYMDRKHTCKTTGCNFGPAIPTPSN